MSNMVLSQVDAYAIPNIRLYHCDCDESSSKQPMQLQKEA